MKDNVREKKKGRKEKSKLQRKLEENIPLPEPKKEKQSISFTRCPQMKGKKEKGGGNRQFKMGLALGGGTEGGTILISCIRIKWSPPGGKETKRSIEDIRESRKGKKASSNWK